MNNNKRTIIIFWLTLVMDVCAFAAIDQAFKIFALASLKDKAPKTLIKGFLGLNYVENDGAAWGIFSGRLSILLFTTILMLLAVGFAAHKIGKNGFLLGNKRKAALGFLKFDIILIMSGGIGNLIDRVGRGYVIDFIEFRFIEFPVFNIADCYLTVGAVIFMVLCLFVFKDNEINILLKGEKGAKSHDEIPD